MPFSQGDKVIILQSEEFAGQEAEVEYGRCDNGKVWAWVTEGNERHGRYYDEQDLELVEETSK